MATKACMFAAQAVPRYTSYPTAPHFSGAVTADTYAAWLEALPAEEAVSLYLHVPYCVELCLYCGCHTKITRRRTPIEEYAAALAQEIALVGRLAGRRKAVHLHWGGGTPSILGSARLIALTEALHRAFDCSALVEHAIELDPRRVTRELADVLGQIGVNRASLGAQDFSPEVQQAIGRIQPFERVAEAAAMLREGGIAALNIDLMYGLPRQTEDHVRRSITLAHQLGPRRLALFGYAHVPWFKTHQRLIDEATLPGAEARFAQAETARETLIGLGYVPIGLDHFARPDDDLARAAPAGALRRNFQGYTSDRATSLIGLGASAIGHLPQGYVQNAPDVGGYRRDVEAGLLATRKGIALGADDRLRAAIIERLMCDFAVDLAAFTDGGTDFGAELAALAPLVAEGLVTLEARRVRVTEGGRPFVRLVAAAFDAYLAQSKARHSVAV